MWNVNTQGIICQDGWMDRKRCGTIYAMGS